jgi:hypothetical protein
MRSKLVVDPQSIVPEIVIPLEKFQLSSGISTYCEELPTKGINRFDPLPVAGFALKFMRVPL